MTRLADGDLDEARRSAPRWQWARARDGLRREALISLGRLRFEVAFDRVRGPDAWDMGWEPDDATRLLLERARFGPEGGRRQGGHGLFPQVDGCLREILAEFMARHEPETLVVRGSDARRNAHNAAHYEGCAPDGFAMERIVEPGARNAGADGVVGIRFVRREPAPGFGP